MRTLGSFVFPSAAAAQLCASTLATAANPLPLRVIFAGFGRSGTTSLAAGLTRLGYRPIHGSVLAPRLTGSHAALGSALIGGDVAEVLRITSEMGYDVAMESHAVYWKEMAALVPDAKVVFMVRDFDPWVESLERLWAHLFAPVFRFPLRMVPFFGAIVRLNLHLRMVALGLDDIAQVEESMDPTLGVNRKLHKRAYDKFVSEMEDFLRDQPSRSLKFELKDGYPALCEFLEIHPGDCPTEEFPHIYSATAVRNQGMFLRGIELVIYILSFALVGFIFKIIWRWTRRYRINGLERKQQ